MPPHKRIALCILLSLSFVGCATPPAPSDTPEPPTNFRAINLNRDLLTEQEAPEKWWQVFQDPTLNALQEIAISSNLDIRDAAARVEQSRASLGLQKSSQGLQVGVAGDYSRSRLSEHSRMALLGAPTQPTDYWTLGAAASWEADLWGHLQQLTDAARARYLASQYTAAGIRVTTLADVASNYWLLRSAERQLALAEEEVRIHQDLLTLQVSRERNGMGTRFQTEAVRAKLDAANATLPPLRNQRHQFASNLALLLGKKPGSLDSLLNTESQSPQLPDQIPLSLDSTVAKQRPDIQQAAAQLQAAIADVGAARADFYPRIQLSASGGYEAFELSDLGNWSSRTFAVGPSLYLPIFQGGRLRRMLELTQAQQQSAAINYQRVVLNAWHEIANALSEYRNALDRETDMDNALAHSSQALFSAKRAFDQGHASQITVLSARLAELRARQSQDITHTGSLLSTVALYRAVGSGWQSAMDSATVENNSTMSPLTVSTASASMSGKAND